MSFRFSPLIRRIAKSKPSHISTPLIRTTRLQSAAYIRWNSTQPQPQSTEPSQPPINPHRNFYKQFGRPVAKVFLMAIFTYQFIYWVWVKLDLDEIVKEREAEVKVLEARLEEVMKERDIGAKGKK